jgi:hypothetical protein
MLLDEQSSFAAMRNPVKNIFEIHFLRRRCKQRFVLTHVSRRTRRAVKT